MRGEYTPAAWELSTQQELPPRARRIRKFGQENFRAVGTTSACAENTKVSIARKMFGLELPPRARRIHFCADDSARAAGTTSACAENTSSLVRNQEWGRNYLRVRGEYRGNSEISEWIEELPPRARRIRCEKR